MSHIYISENEVNGTMALTVNVKGTSITEAYKAVECKIKELLSCGWAGVSNHSSYVLVDKVILFKDVSKALWEELGDVPTNDADELDEDWLYFDKGTERLEVWHWFEEEFNLCVATDLMFVS